MVGKVILDSTIPYLKVKDLVEGPEKKHFIGTVMNVTKVCQTLVRIKLLDCEGDSIYCMLFDKWAYKNISIKKGNKVELGPSLLKTVPEEFKNFYCPGNEATEGLIYFHFENEELGLKVIEVFEPLTQVDLLGHTGSTVNVQGALVDCYKVQYDKGHLIEIAVIDCSIQVPVRLRVYRSGLDARIGDVIRVYSVSFVNVFNDTYGLAAVDSEIEVLRYQNRENFDSAVCGLFENFDRIVEKIRFFPFEASPFFCCVLERFCNFPEIGKFFYVVFDQTNFYFLISFTRVSVGWVKVTRCKVNSGYVEIDDMSDVCEFPEWLEPVKQITENYSNQLQLVKQEAIRSTAYFHSIYQ